MRQPVFHLFRTVFLIHFIKLIVELAFTTSSIRSLQTPAEAALMFIHPNCATMTRTHFCNLPMKAQYASVNKDGVLLFHRTGVRVTSELYQLDGFYVELLFDEQKQLLSLVSFEETVKLLPYLHQVDISDLTSLLRR